MNWNKTRIIYKKEIRDLMRDKKTMIMMVLVPLLLYPLIMVGAMFVTQLVMDKMDHSTYYLAISYEDFGADVVFDKKEFQDFLLENGEETYTLKIVNSKDPQQDLKDEKLDGYIRVSQKEERLFFQIVYTSSKTNSNALSEILRKKFEAYQEKMEASLLKDLGVDAEYLMAPILYEENDVATKEESVGNLLGTILPFLMIISILLGAMYPAIDLTAGEKERGTLETLLTLPVRNIELISGKFLAVATISVISAVLNILSMAFVGIYIMNLAGEMGGAVLDISVAEMIPVLLIVLLCIVAFAMFISAMVMCVTIFAKSFKEANNYLTPVMLVVMLTGYIGFIPNVELTPITAAVPVVNICLLVKNMLVFKFSFSLVFITLITNLLYGAIMVVILAKLYNSESLLFSEGGASFQIFSKRSDLRRGGVPTITDAVLVITVSVLLLIFGGTILQLKFALIGVGISQLLLVSVPLIAAWYTKSDFKRTFSLRGPRIRQLVGCLFIEIGLYGVISLLSIGLSKIWPEDADAVNQTFGFLMEDMSFVPALIIIAVLPAICEELLFRGYFFGAFREKGKPYVGILVTAVIFGIYHFSLVKFFTTTLLGLAFCYVVYRTGSIFCSMFMHFLNNAVSVVAMYWIEDSFASEAAAQAGGTPKISEILIILGVSFICFSLGKTLLKEKQQLAS